MNKQALLDRLALINKSLEQISANFQATQGSKQEIQYWLTLLETEEHQKLESTVEIKLTPEELPKLKKSKSEVKRVNSQAN